jgi:tripeptide aminopeptidase
MTSRVPDSVALFCELAAIPSPSSREAAVADRVCAYLEELGLDVAEQPLPGSESRNLLCRLPARASGQPLLFCAHLDTVTPNGPVEPVLDDGLIRNAGGTILGADDKAAVAVLLAAAHAIVRNGRPHAGIELLFTCQEEIGLQGIKAFDCSRLEARAGFVFDDASPVGHIVVSAPFQENLELTFQGRAAHAGLAPEQGASAILAAARAIAAMPHGRIDAESTANVGVIGGGVARNIVAEACSIEIDVRSYAASRAHALVTELLACCEAAAARTGCTLDQTVFEGYPGYALAADDPPVALAGRALRACGHEPVLISSGGGVDANVLNARGIPTANLGNGMQGIHSADEQIAARDVRAMVDVTLALIEEAARS